MQGAGLTSSGHAPCRIKAAASGLIVILHRSVNMLPLLNFSLSPETNTTGAVDWTQVYEAVRWIQLIMALFSILGSGSIICLIIPRLSHTPELQPLFQLSVADLLLAACWLIGAVLYSQRCNQLSLLCYNLHTVEQILYMASFFFTLNYVWNLYTVTREKFNSCFSGYSVQFSNRVSLTAKLIALFSSLVPALLMVPVFVQGNAGHCQTNFSEPYRCLLMHTGALFLRPGHQQLSSTCSILHRYQIVVFLSTFLFTLLGITILVVKARCIQRRAVTANGYLGNEQRALFRVMDLRMLLYPLVFVFCWGPAVTLAFLRVAKPSSGHGVLGVCLYISEAFTSASQGFLNCLVYGWTRLHLRRAGLMFFSRDVDTQTPLLRSQQSRSYHTPRTIG
ncbi:transmembrane protein 116 [Cyprinodon tularosa]|uniref:transmembrane protein 116 n=1 Tax=Cyprinodon tularosa TaxID=77115 RepID=UPI0018E1DC35|nr:transmembrane protein 116 [Cyprinodon tularosa]